MKSTSSNADYATADTDGSVCRRNGRPYNRVTIGSTITPAITAGYNYPNNTNPPTTCVGTEKCKFTNQYLGLRLSLLLHHFKGAVLQREGCQRLGHDPLRQSVGPDDLQVRSIWHQRAHF